MIIEGYASRFFERDLNDDVVVPGAFKASLAGLSIGFRTVKARKDETGRMRVLTEIDLWEVSFVTFPMLPSARLMRVLEAV
ncbi:MAG: hypothetical protein B7Z26_06080 [Asticcacaulis sp. 32-58-5]|nr:MAG: hypothetical protein B7Z26_06080 [Asticcacaulis sp. 32-58-5]